LLEHLSGTAAITHTFAEVLDDMSTTYGNNDGFTLCGARTYTKVSLTSVDNGAPDDAIVSLDSASRTFTIQGTTNLHYGEYEVTYRAQLTAYTTVIKDFTFTFKVYPDCASATFTQTSPILAMTTPLTIPVT